MPSAGNWSTTIGPRSPAPASPRSNGRLPLFYAQMEARGIEAGSERALRLFS